MNKNKSHVTYCLVLIIIIASWLPAKAEKLSIWKILFHPTTINKPSLHDKYFYRFQKFCYKYAASKTIDGKCLPSYDISIKSVAEDKEIVECINESMKKNYGRCTSTLGNLQGNWFNLFESEEENIKTLKKIHEGKLTPDEKKWLDLKE